MSYKAHPIVDQIAQLIHGKGEFCSFGCKEDEIESMIARTKELFPGKPFSVVSEWSWADIEVKPRDAFKLREAGVEPIFLYADCVKRDEAHRWPSGSCVTTTLLVSFRENCIFGTRNTSYILLGHGRRMTVSPDVYIQLMS